VNRSDLDGLGYRAGTLFTAQGIAGGSLAGSLAPPSYRPHQS